MACFSFRQDVVETGSWITFVKQDFLCTLIVHKRSYFFAQKGAAYEGSISTHI